MTSRWIALGILLLGCQPPSPSVESNDLGITEVVIDHSDVQGERLLTLRGLDRDGAAIATATLRTGMVLYGADVPEELHPGTELTISVRDTNASFVSPDRVPHVNYEPLSPAVATFVGLRAVARAIENEAGIRFAPPQRVASGEIPFTSGACDGSRFPTNKGGANQCCQDNENTYHVNPTTLAVVNRSTYAPAYPSTPACRKSDGTTGCTTNCLYGPCGSAITSTKGTNGHVFHPTSNSNVCGWDDGGAGGLGVDYSPEHYASQSLYGGVTASCLWTGCFSSGLRYSYRYIKPSNPSTMAAFGASPSISSDGNTMAVGSPWGDPGGGRVVVFTQSAGVWTQQQSVNNPWEEDDEFGGTFQLSDDGNTMVIGASHEDSSATGINGDSSDNSVADSGAAWVFVRSGSTWTQQAYLKASNTDAGDNFGSAVAISSDGNTIAVAAQHEDSSATGINGNQSDNSATDSGGVYVFTRSGSTWTQQAYIKASITDASDDFGISISISDNGNTLAVGAEYEDSTATGIGGNQTNNSGTDEGAVYVLTRSGGVWSQQAYVKAGNTVVGQFGTSVALSADGNTLAVGAPLHTQGENNVGSLYVFTRSGGVWSQQAFIQPSNGDQDDYFGNSVAISGTTGDVIAVSAKFEDSNATTIGGNMADNSAEDSGAVYRYTRSAGSWTFDAYIKASNTEAGDDFGQGISLSADGKVLVLGASGEDSNASTIDGNQLDNSMTNAGAAYVVKFE